jgi:hypothetical protein
MARTVKVDAVSAATRILHRFFKFFLQIRSHSTSDSDRCAVAESSQLDLREQLRLFTKMQAFACRSFS